MLNVTCLHVQTYKINNDMAVNLCDRISVKILRIKVLHRVVV